MFLLHGLIHNVYNYYTTFTLIHVWPSAFRLFSELLKISVLFFPRGHYGNVLYKPTKEDGQTTPDSGNETIRDIWGCCGSAPRHSHMIGPALCICWASSCALAQHINNTGPISVHASWAADISDAASVSVFMATVVHHRIHHPTHCARGVVPTLDQRQWRWFNVATTSCAQCPMSTNTSPVDQHDSNDATASPISADLLVLFWHQDLPGSYILSNTVPMLGRHLWRWPTEPTPAVFRVATALHQEVAHSGLRAGWPSACLPTAAWSKHPFISEF